ncbi:hypothetical protein G7046_g6408 [Stylonectria norvegica]|nr:hypothetical protein G7046_g6408 [Stylonectria norvegica]
MDEASLVESFESKLEDLERKVQTYRQCMVDGFQRYYLDQVRVVSPIIVSRIAQSLARSIADYPDLNPDLAELRIFPPADSRAVAVPGSGLRHQTPPADVSGVPGVSAARSVDSATRSVVSAVAVASPVAAAASGAAEPPRSPHAREKELQGLFVPSYLPLLECAREPSKDPPAVPPRHSHDVTLLPEPAFAAALGQGADMDTRIARPEPQALVLATPQSPARPGSVRPSTDDIPSPSLSDKSDAKTPRSALRRSSTAPKTPQSPRRVRFEFMGAEVLPTASPQPTDLMDPRASSPASTPDPLGSNSTLSDEAEDYLPPARRISSTEALRSLSRTPLEEGTVWTVVTSIPDDEILVEQEDMSTFLPAAPDPPSPAQPIQISDSNHRSQKLGSLSEEPEEDIDDDEDNSSDEEFLSMAKPRSFTNKKVANPTSPIRESESVPPRTTDESALKLEVVTTDKARGPSDDGFDEDDLFFFEGGLSAPPKPRPQDLSIKEEVVEDDLDMVPESGSDLQQSLYATSPAITIARHSMVNGPTSPTTPTMAKFQAGSLGSYKGRPVIMPVVRNPEVLAQAASLGQFNTFVGGLDGRSGMDEGDLSSFRASFANTGFSGTPRSFTERLMMEDAQQERARGGGMSNQ